MSRLEGFSDAVFAFAITLLVVSLEVPKTYDELMAAIRAFPAFAVCFALLFQVWWRHYRFFRLYDLEDAYVITLTGLLLFVVLFYVYPLKFVWTLAFSALVGRQAGDAIRADQAAVLFYIYGIGVVAVFAILALLHLHAYRQRDALGLTPEETLALRVRIYSNVGVASVGVLSIVVAAVCARFAPRVVGLAGYTYTVIGFVEWGVGDFHGRERRKLAASTLPASTADISRA